MSSWLDKSGQRWKTKNPWLATLIVVMLVFLVGILNGANGPPRWTILAMLALAAVGRIVGLLLPLFVRCGVCGVHLATCAVARSMSGLARPAWWESLQACPVCNDDGRATLVAIRAWQASGQAPEAPYWSSGRVLLGILTAILLISVGVLVVTRVGL